MSYSWYLILSKYLLSEENFLFYQKNVLNNLLKNTLKWLENKMK